jgi:alkane 1-monooxygenase
LVRAAAFEITNHAHHHMEPSLPFYELVPDPTAPQMPSALLCLLAALVPPVWERAIAMPRLRDWDRNFATPEERELAAAANRAAGWPEWQTGDEGPTRSWSAH